MANAQSNTVSTYEIDAGTGSLRFVGDIGAGTLPVGVTANFDGKYLYVLNHSSENISAYGIDTVMGQLVDRCGLKRVWARDLWHLRNRLLRMVLMHTVAVLFNLQADTPPLQLERLAA